MEVLSHFIKEALEVLTISHCILVLFTALFALIFESFRGVPREGCKLRGKG